MKQCSCCRDDMIASVSARNASRPGRAVSISLSRKDCCSAMYTAVASVSRRLHPKISASTVVLVSAEDGAVCVGPVR